MNKRRNKSVTKTKHRVQKTKRSRRLNKNRSVKGIRGNNKTKVVGKRRNIVQSGGGRIDDLVGRIFGLNTIEGEIPNSVIDNIMKDVTVENTRELTSIEKPDHSIVNDGISLLYAACRLKNHPSPYLVSKILDKMRDQHTGTSAGSLYKSLIGKERSSEWNRIIPNGSSNGSYPQHGAVQAAREILEKCPTQDDVTTNTKLNEIIKILKVLKEYDASVPKLTGIQNALMTLPNNLSGVGSFTAYEEFTLSFGWAISVEGLIRTMLPKYADELVGKFEQVLGKPKPILVLHPPPPGKAMGGNVAYYPESHGGNDKAHPSGPSTPLLAGY